MSGKPRNLMVIEAPGKIPALRAVLAKLGVSNIDIFATKGYLMANPDALTPLGIDKRFQETLRGPVLPDLVESLDEMVEAVGKVFIATDADQEGDVIALDVANLVAGRRPIERLALRGLDAESVREAVLSKGELDPLRAIPGTTRRIIDRMIGGTLSDRQSGFAVGRVQSALLGLCAAEDQIVGEAVLQMPAADRGRPFQAVAPVTRGLHPSLAKLLEMGKKLDAAIVGEVVSLPPPVPWNFGETVLNVQRQLGGTPKEAASAMQQLYEAGKMSYPRSSAHGLTQAGVAAIERIAGRNGIRFSGEDIPRMTEKNAHESPRPLDTSIRLGLPLRMLCYPDAVLTIITRHLILCGKPRLVEKPNLSNIPDWARDLDWGRDVGGGRAWTERQVKPGMNMFTPEVAAMGVLVRHGLGRPSTQVSHAVKFASRGLVDPLFNLTEKGQQWHAATPEIFLNPMTSIEIENAVETLEGLPSSRIEKILEMLDPKTREAVLKEITEEASSNQEARLFSAMTPKYRPVSAS